MTESTALRPSPTLSKETAFFWEAAKQSRLCVQQCKACNRLYHPPRPMCPNCHGVDMVSKDLSGRGQVYSWTVPRYPPLPMFDEGLIVALVDLDEGVRLLTNIHGIDHEEIKQGLAVELFFVDAEDNFKIPQFRPIHNAKGGLA